MKANLIRILPLFLAAVLQIMPFLRTVLPAIASGSAPSGWNLIFRLGTGAVALLGSTHAVSGASSISLSPNAGTVGTPSTWVVQYSGQYSTVVKSWQCVTNWQGKQTVCGTSYQIAPGLFLSNSANKLVTITGTPTQAGTFPFTLKIWSAASCSGGDSDIRSATITITGNNSAPVFSSAPTNQTVTAGGAASFAGLASGTPSPSYSWKLGNTTVAGATTNTLTLSNVQTNQAGLYTLSASNSVAVVSVSAGLTVVVPLANQAASSGATVSFTAAAYSPAVVSYSWRSNGIAIPSANGATLTLTNVQPLWSATYSVVMSNAFTFTTNAATLVVSDPVSIPVLSSQPVSRILKVGQTLTLSVSAVGSGLNYQWLLNSNHIAGAVSSTLSISGVTADQSGFYAVRVFNTGGSVTSTNARVLIVPEPSAAMSPTIQWPFTGGGEILGSWSIFPGYRYVLQFSSNLGSSTWQTVTNIAPAFEGSVFNFAHQFTSPVGFYRVLVLGPSVAGP